MTQISSRDRGLPSLMTRDLPGLMAPGFSNPHGAGLFGPKWCRIDRASWRNIFQPSWCRILERRHWVEPPPIVATAGAPARIRGWGGPGALRQDQPHLPPSLCSVFAGGYLVWPPTLCAGLSIDRTGRAPSVSMVRQREPRASPCCADAMPRACRAGKSRRCVR
jgi:hypothetical protein